MIICAHPTPGFSILSPEAICRAQAPTNLGYNEQKGEEKATQQL